MRFRRLRRGYLTRSPAHGIDPRQRTAGRGASWRVLVRSDRPGPADAPSRSSTTPIYAGCRDDADRSRRRHRPQPVRVSRRAGLRLDAGGRNRRPGGAADESAVLPGAAVLRAGRDPAGRGGYARDVARYRDLARERRAARHLGDLHDCRHDMLPAGGAPLGSVVRAAGRQPGLDGPGHGAGGRVRRRYRWHRNRAGDARPPDRARVAGRTCPVRIRGRAVVAEQPRGAVAVRAGLTDRGVGHRGIRHAAHPVSGRTDVWRHGWLRVPARHGMGAQLTPLVGRQWSRADAGSRCGLALHECQRTNVAELPWGGLWLLCSRGGGRRLIRGRRRAGPPVSDRRRDGRVRTGRPGHHDGARARDAPRPRLCRGSSPGAFPGGQLFGGTGGPAYGAAYIGCPGQALETARPGYV